MADTGHCISNREFCQVPEYFCSHPKLGSLVVSSFQEKSHSDMSTPMYKDPKQLDFFRKKSYLSALLQLRLTNYQAMLVKYDFLIWDRVLSLVTKFPFEATEEMKDIMQDR